MSTSPIPVAPLASLQASLRRLCSDEELAPESTVFVSDGGACSAAAQGIPAYGWQDLQGRALALAEGIKMARPELHVFVITSEAECCGVGAAHWIHALRHNMNLTVIVQGQHGGARSRQQAAAGSPATPGGAALAPLNPLSVSLGVPGASFIAQAVDWIPDLLDDIVHAAFKHRGLSFVRLLHRASFASSFDPWLHDPQRSLLLTHVDGLQPSRTLSSIYRNQRVHDPADLERARAAAAQEDPIPVGILYRNAAAACYEDLRHAAPLRSPEFIRAGLARELDRATVWPGARAQGARS